MSAMTHTYIFQGCVIPTEDTFMTLQPEDGKFPIEFGFEANETGYIYEDDTVFFDYRGTDQYQFKNRQDAFVYFFGDGKTEYQHSFYVGSRESHPTLDGWCKRMGIGVQEDEDGSSVFSAWKTVSAKKELTFWVRYNLQKDRSPIADGFDTKEEAEKHILKLLADGYKPQRKYNLTDMNQLNL